MQLLRRRRGRGVLSDVRGREGGVPPEGLEAQPGRGASGELVSSLCCCCRCCLCCCLLPLVAIWLLPLSVVVVCVIVVSLLLACSCWLLAVVFILSLLPLSTGLC